MDLTSFGSSYDQFSLMCRIPSKAKVHLFLFNLNFFTNFFNLESSNEPWMVGKAPCMIGKASFNYQAGSADELSFNMGDVIAMAPTEKQPYQADGWLLARKIGDASGAHINGPSPIGLVPSNHFKTLYNSKFLFDILFIFKTICDI